MVGSNSVLLQVTSGSRKFFALSTQSNYSWYLKLAFFTDKLEISQDFETSKNLSYSRYLQSGTSADLLEISGFIIVKISAQSCRAAAFQDWV
jgi:hypothetical protein